MDIQTKDGILLRGIPDGTPDDVIKARIEKIRAEGGTTPAASPAPTSAEKETSYLQHAGNLLAGAVRGAGSIGATILAPWDIGKDLVAGNGLSLEANRERRRQMDEGLGLMGAETDSAMYGAGKIGAEIAGTAGAGGVLGNTLRAVSSSPKVAAMADALASYGMGKGGHAVGYFPRVAAGGAAGGTAAALVNPDEVGMGAAVGAALPAVAPVATVGGKFIANATGPMRESWRTGQGRKFLEEMLGDPAKAKVIQAIARGQGAGRTTVADDIAAANLGQTEKFGSPLVSIEEKLATQAGGLSDKAKAIVARQEAARVTPLEAISKLGERPLRSEGQMTPTKSLAESVRSTITEPIYNKAMKDVIQVSDDLAEILKGAEIQGAVKRGGLSLDQAITNATVSGKTIPMGYSPGRTQTGYDLPEWSIAGPRTPDVVTRPTASIDVLKRVKDEISGEISALKNATDSDGITKLRQLKTAAAQLDKEMRAGSKSYVDAQDTFKALSSTQNQADVAKALLDSLQSPLGKERAAAFALAKRNAPSTIKNKAGLPMFDELEQVFSPTQMRWVEGVEKGLARDVERASLGASVDTKHLFEIADKTKGTVSFPTLLSRPAMLANWIMQKVGHGADEMIAQDMGNLMLSDPAAFSAKYLKDIPPSSRKQAFDVLMKHYGTPTIGAAAPVVAAQQRR